MKSPIKLVLLGALIAMSGLSHAQPKVGQIMYAPDRSAPSEPAIEPIKYDPTIHCVADGKLYSEGWIKDDMECAHPEKLSGFQEMRRSKEPLRWVPHPPRLR